MSRYWRISEITTGSFLEFSEIQLLAGSTVASAGVTPTAPASPIAGSLAELVDGNLGTYATWPNATVTDPGFSFTFDFGSAVTITGFKQAGRDTAGRHMTGFKLSRSSDGSTWTEVIVLSGLAYPGNFTLSAEIPTLTFTLSGTVVDGSASPVERTIRVYRRDTGALLGSTTSSATTGAYSLSIPYDGEVTVLCLDDAAGTLENDRVHRTFAV